jgi:DNA-directed RNA polymerase subunit RPC12/RpoP
MDNMDARTFHGAISPKDFAQALVAEFSQGNMRAQAVGHGDQLVVQIASVVSPSSGGRTAISVHLQEIEDGVHVQVGEQEWLGVAASLGVTALSALRNPLSLLGRLDDLAQDVSSMQLAARVWQTLERAARSLGASLEISDRLRRVACEYCDTANLVGAPNCVACGAPLGSSQPVACPNCGFVPERGAEFCPQCGQDLG